MYVRLFVFGNHKKNAQATHFKPRFEMGRSTHSPSISYGLFCKIIASIKQSNFLHLPFFRKPFTNLCVSACILKRDESFPNFYEK